MRETSSNGENGFNFSIQIIINYDDYLSRGPQTRGFCLTPEEYINILN